MTNKKDFEIAIIGGGISGLTLGIALHARGVPATIYEQAHHFAEIGAGVSFRENAIQSMKHCHEGVYEAFTRVRTTNLWPEKKNVWFDYHDGFHDEKETFKFQIRTAMGQAGVHRAHYLDELIHLFPKDQAKFGRRLQSLSRGDDGKWTLTFTDSSTATADAVIGCDGIKSRVRQLMYGEENPCSHPTYTHKYAYRGLIPMEDAVAAVGDEKAKNACMHMGPGGHMLTFPVNHGKTLNIVAFHTNEDEWPDYNKLTRPAKREQALKDFEGYGRDVTSLLKLCKPDLDCWAIFHLGDHPVPHFAQGTICLVGDAAHATSPHHGAGAGMCIEDAAVLADLLEDERVQASKDIEAVFATFDDVRKERGQWLVGSSQHIGNCYEWIGEEVGEDFGKIEKEILERNGLIGDVDVPKMCVEAKEALGTRLGAVGKD